MNSPDDGIQRSLGRLEGKMDEVLTQMQAMNKNQNSMWKEINDIRREIITLKTQKIGWGQLGSAVKVIIGAISAISGLIIGLISVKGGI